MTCGHFLQLAAGRAKQPSALILNSRILQSTPESGARAAKIAHRRPSLTMLLEANSGPGAGPDDQRVLRAHEPGQAHPMPTDFREELMARFHDGQPGTPARLDGRTSPCPPLHSGAAHTLGMFLGQQAEFPARQQSKKRKPI
jgi:hypothetical protein